MLLALILACAAETAPTPAPAAPAEEAAEEAHAEAAESGAANVAYGIATADPNVDVMVKDKAYGIFLPFDAAGKKVAVKGTFSVEILPLEEARHYASDAGKDPNTITEAPKTFLMDADGVALL